MSPDLPFDRPMSRRTDPGTSKDSAAVVRPELGKIQRLVLQVYTEHGPMTAREAERRAEFDDYGFSTVRKRISELAAGGYLEVVGVDTSRRSPAQVYGIPKEEKQ